jgi:hypothetical protein
MQAAFWIHLNLITSVMMMVWSEESFGVVYVKNWRIFVLLCVDMVGFTYLNK